MTTQYDLADLDPQEAHETTAVSEATSPASDAGLVTRIELGGTPVDLMHDDVALAVIRDRYRHPQLRPLAVVSANLDHVHKFGSASPWQGVLEQAEADGDLDVVTLLDGMPLVHRAERLTGTTWPRLAGSDLIDPILDEAAEHGVRVGFIGGLPSTHDELRRVLAERRPDLVLAGTWAPERHELADPEAARGIALEIAAAGVDLLVVCLGKPRQELWIAEHGAASGARVLLAFGAVVDFLAEKVSRAPEWISRAGMEWSYRLAKEPRRLARRYLVEGPPAYRALRRDSRLIDLPVDQPVAVMPAPAPVELVRRVRPGLPGAPVGSVVVPAHARADDLGRTVAPLADLVGEGRIELVVTSTGCDPAATGRTALAPWLEGATVLEAGPSEVAALNAGDAAAQHWPRLYLDAEVDITPGAVLDLFAAMAATGALAGRCEFRYDTSAATWPVRAYYRARSRLPECRQHLWGAGGYALSRAGRARFVAFPDLVADDLFIDSLFDADEKLVVATEPMVVSTPADLTGLLAQLRRVQGGNAALRTTLGTQQLATSPRTTGRTLRQLVLSARSPRRLLDAAAYAVVMVLARVRPPSRAADTGCHASHGSDRLSVVA